MSGIKRHNETVDAGDQQPGKKYQKLELESDDLGNSWALPSGQATYGYSHITQRFKGKEKILSVTPVPSNIDLKEKKKFYLSLQCQVTLKIELLIEKKRTKR